MSEHKRLVREVVVRIGSCLLQYQDIEIALKTLLPHMVPPDYVHRSTDSFSEAIDLFASKQTLGPLFETYKKHLETDNPDNFSRYLAAVAEHRNELVHGFRLRQEGWLKTEDECRAALVLLDERYQFAQLLKEAVAGQLRGLVQIFDEMHPGDFLSDDSDLS